jgi:MoaE-MoaD fusion protein
MRVHVKFFAIFRERVGIRDEWAELADGTTVEQLWKQYAARSPQLDGVRAAYAVDQKLAKPDQVLQDGDEVGFLPPVSGGAKPQRTQRTQRKRKKISVSPVSSVAKDARITRKPLDLNALAARVAMAHRVGKLEIGEVSLIIAVAAPHRPEAYAASRYAIERVKAVLPVWKKEFASDGDHWVEGPLAGEVSPEKAEEIARGGAIDSSPG